MTRKTQNAPVIETPAVETPATETPSVVIPDNIARLYGVFETTPKDAILSILKESPDVITAFSSDLKPSSKFRKSNIGKAFRLIQELAIDSKAFHDVRNTAFLASKGDHDKTAALMLKTVEAYITLNSTTGKALISALPFETI